MTTPIVAEASGFKLPPQQVAVIRWNIIFGFATFAVGVLFGLEQAFNYANVNLIKHYPVIHS